ncbi:MAG: hypothetical protein HYY17_06270 [Planctomycetes bacterium]|nr:hypothetical protein [Planctomycetota bacterium]
MIAAGLIILASFVAHEALEGVIERQVDPRLHRHLHAFWGLGTSLLVAVVLLASLGAGMRVPLPQPFPLAEEDALEAENQWLIRLRWSGAVIAAAVIVLMKGVFDFLPGTRAVTLYAAVACVPAGNGLFILLLRGFGANRTLLRAQILFSKLMIAVLVYLTGAIDSPLLFMCVIPPMLAAIVLPRREAVTVALLGPALIAGILIAESRGILPHHTVTLPHSVVTLLALTLALLVVAVNTTAIIGHVKRRESQFVHAAKMAAVGELAGAVAHEINNPVAIVSAKLETIRRNGVPEPIAGELDRILGQVRRVGDITHGLLAYSRPSPGKREPTDLNRVARDTAELANGRVRQRGVRLVTELDPALPAVLANSNEMAQVTLNLLNNALDATPQGGSVCLRTRARGGAAALEVQDTGCGIAPEVRPRLFDPFFTTKAESGGTGLGLAVCHGLVRSHGGRIEVESEPGRGSLFRVVLPEAGKGAEA